MAEIYININEIRDTNYNLPSIREKIVAVNASAKKIKGQLAADIPGKYEIRQRLDSACKEIEEMESQIQELYEVTGSCAEQYEQAEYRNKRNAEAFC